MDSERVTAIKKALRKAGLDALVLRLPENIVMSMGAWPMNGFSYAVFTASEGPTALIAPSCEDQEMGDCWASDVRFFIWPRLDMPDPLQAIRQQLIEVAAHRGLQRARLGYEGSFESIAPPYNAGEPMVPCETSIAFLKSIFPKARWTDATSLLHGLRACKTEAEIRRLRLAHRVADKGLNRFHRSVVPGVSEAGLAAAVYQECLTAGVSMQGVRHVNVFPQVSTGLASCRAWRPVVSTGKRKLHHGDLAVLELAVCVDGFWADVTRVKVAGKPSGIQKAAFAAVKAAQAAAVQSIKPGVRASHPHHVATKILIEAGFEKCLVHLTGHGVGFRYHEPEPFLMPGNGRLRLKRGHVCSVEPGLYSPSWGGIRLEDNVAVTATGVEVLTPAPKRI